MFGTIPYPSFIVEIDDYLSKFGISLYSILLVIGVAVLVEYFIRQMENKHGYTRAKTNKFLILLAIALVITYAFSAIFDGLFHLLNGEPFSNGGLTFISGFLGGVISFSILIYFFMREEKKNILKILNIIIPGVVLAHAIGRIGCFTAGCCHGIPTASFLGVVFPNNYASSFLYPHEAVHPTQLYEAFFLFVLFFLISYVPKIKDHKFVSYLIGYGIFRMILETYFRGDNRGTLFGLAPSLLLSIFMIISGGLILYFSLIKKNEVLLKE